jgi:hypothetical protein
VLGASSLHPSDQPEYERAGDADKDEGDAEEQRDGEQADVDN